MKKLKRIASLLFVFVMVFALTSCIRMDIGVEIKKDGTGSITAKMSIEESAYESLMSMGGSEESDEEFVKETIDGKTYYSATKTEEFESYEKLVDALGDLEAVDGSRVFREIVIEEENQKYTFSLKTPVIENPAENMEYEKTENWLLITMTVKMPGNVKNTNGEKQKDGSVRFVMNDFTQETEYFVYSVVPSTFDMILFGVIGTAIVLGLFFFLNPRKKKEKKEEMKDEASEKEEEALVSEEEKRREKEKEMMAAETMIFEVIKEKEENESVSE